MISAARVMYKIPYCVISSHLQLVSFLCYRGDTKKPKEKAVASKPRMYGIDHLSSQIRCVILILIVINLFLCHL